MNVSTVEPPNNGHSGDWPLVHCREFVPISKVICYNQLGALGSLSILRRLSASQSVHYRRFHCIYMYFNCMLYMNNHVYRNTFQI